MTVRRWAAAAVGALALSVATGLAAAYFRPEDEQTVAFFAFALVQLPVWFGLFTIVLTPDRDQPAHPEDSVESTWLLRASSGAFYDLFIALGLTTAVTTIADMSPLDPALFLVLAMVDVGVRYLVLRRRES